MNVSIHLYRDRERGLRVRFDFSDGSQHVSSAPVRDSVYLRVVLNALHVLACHVSGAVECRAKLREALGAEVVP